MNMEKGNRHDHAPEECRDSMIENLPLHRDIMAASTAEVTLLGRGTDALLPSCAGC